MERNRAAGAPKQSQFAATNVWRPACPRAGLVSRMSISSTLVHRAEIRFHGPAEVLRPHVGCFWVATAERGATIRVVPDGTTAVSVQLQGGRPADWVLRGPMLRPAERRFTSPAVMVGVRLRPGVAFLLTGIAAHSIVGRRVSLKRAAAFRALASIDSHPPTPERCIEALQRVLIERLTNASVQEVVATAIREIERERGRLRVVDVAARCGASPRHLNRLMRTWVGYGAKRFATVVRFQTTLHEMEQAPGRSSALLASETGYFDQAHLTVEVGRFAGATPGQLASRSVADFSKTRCDDLP